MDQQHGATPPQDTPPTTPPAFAPDGSLSASPATTAPPPSPAVDEVPAAPDAPRRRRWPMVIAVVLIVALAGLSGYLWWINSQWVSQNDTLRADASALGEQLATERLVTAQQAEDLDSVTTELDSVTDRVSDLANEEANAIDDRAALEDITAAMISCADQRQEIIRAYRENLVFDGKSRQQVENETTASCDDVEDAFEDYEDRRESR